MAEHGRRRMKDIFIAKQKEDKIEQAPSEAKAKDKALEQPERKSKRKENREKEKVVEKETRESPDPNQEKAAEKAPEKEEFKENDNKREKEPQKVKEQKETRNMSAVEKNSRGIYVDPNDVLRDGVRTGEISIAAHAIDDLGAVPEAVFDKDDLQSMAKENPDMARYLRSNWSQEAADLDVQPGEPGTNVAVTRPEYDYYDEEWEIAARNHAEGYDELDKNGNNINDLYEERDETWLEKQIREKTEIAEAGLEGKPYYTTKAVSREELEEDFELIH